MTRNRLGMLGAVCMFGGISALILIAYDLNWRVLAVLSAGAVSLRYMAVHKRDAFFLLIIAAVWVIAIQSRLIAFSLFDQARSLMEKNVDPVEFLLTLDLWGPRFLLSYPAIWFSERWQLDLDFAFTIYGSFLMVAQTFVLANLVTYVIAPKNSLTTRVLTFGFFILFILGVGTTMNGRLAAAHLGVAIILFSQVRAIDRRSVTLGTWSQHALGMFLTMMTSGTAMVGFLQVACAPIILSGSRRRSRWSVILPVVAVLIVAFPIIQSGIEKNLEYWGGGVESLGNMLEHGWGQFLATNPIVVSLGVLVVGLSYLLIALKQGRRNPKLLPLVLNIPASVVCGIYGYSTLTMVLPALASALFVVVLQVFSVTQQRRVVQPSIIVART